LLEVKWSAAGADIVIKLSSGAYQLMLHRDAAGVWVDRGWLFAARQGGCGFGLARMPRMAAATAATTPGA
jgi:hypothetical protein